MKTQHLPGFMQGTHESTRIGSIKVDTPRGTIEAIEIPGLTSIMVERDNGDRSIVMLSYDPEHSAGVFVQLSPDLARNMGASLLHLANLVDGGKAQ